MPNLTQVIKVTREQMNTLIKGGSIDGHTLQDDVLYAVEGGSDLVTTDTEQVISGRKIFTGYDYYAGDVNNKDNKAPVFKGLRLADYEADEDSDRYGYDLFGARLSFGDGDAGEYAYIEEDTDDHLRIYADNGITFGGGSALFEGGIDIVGHFGLQSQLMVETSSGYSSGTAGQILTSQGAGNPPKWDDAPGGSSKKYAHYIHWAYTMGDVHFMFISSRSTAYTTSADLAKDIKDAFGTKRFPVTGFQGNSSAASYDKIAMSGSSDGSQVTFYTVSGASFYITSFASATDAVISL